MDSGRQHDLAKLYRVLHDPAESAQHKRQAQRTIARIKKVASDPRLARERTRLIKAHRAGDTKEADKIGSIIREYQGRTYGYV